MIFWKKNNFILSLEKEKFKNIKNIFNKKLYKKSLKKGYIKFSPIFIVGMPRSGTTLVEQILSTHDNVFGCDEIEEFFYLYYKDLNSRIDPFSPPN